MPDLKINGPYTGSAIGFFDNDTKLITPASTLPPSAPNAAFAVWEIATKSLIATVPSPQDASPHPSDNLAYKIAKSSDETRLAMLRHNRALPAAVYSSKTWTLEDIIPTQKDQLPPGPPLPQKHSIEFSRDSAWILFGMSSRFALFSANSPKPPQIIQLQSNSFAWSASFNRSGGLIAVVVDLPSNLQDYIGIYSTPNLTEVGRVNGSYVSASWCRDERILIAATRHDAGQIQIIAADRNGARIVWSSNITGGTARVACSPAEAVVAIEHRGHATLNRIVH